MCISFISVFLKDLFLPSHRHSQANSVSLSFIFYKNLGVRCLALPSRTVRVGQRFSLEVETSQLGHWLNSQRVT